MNDQKIIPIFPGEPVITVRAPAIQAQFIETYILLCVNHQSLIATKSNRIVRAAAGRPVSEFGSRRAQGASGAILGARAAYIAGCCPFCMTLSRACKGALKNLAHPRATVSLASPFQTLPHTPTFFAPAKEDK